MVHFNTLWVVLIHLIPPLLIYLGNSLAHQLNRLLTNDFTSTRVGRWPSFSTDSITLTSLGLSTDWCSHAQELSILPSSGHIFPLTICFFFYWTVIACKFRYVLQFYWISRLLNTVVKLICSYFLLLIFPENKKY